MKQGTATGAAYGSSFFRAQSPGSARSAAVIVPLVLSHISVHSLVDVGCGVGTWAAAFHANGVPEVVGLDGSYVDPQMLQIRPEQFIAHDLHRPLREALPKRRFDLGVCLEVAEHLNEDRGVSLVEDLTSLAPCILFSAAVPGQGGTDHLNEQFLSYWARHFKDRGYLSTDLIRPAIWNNEAVDWWYRQNIVFFAEEGHSILTSELRLLPLSAPDQLRVETYEDKLRLATSPTMGDLLKAVPGSFRRSIAARFRRSKSGPSSV